MGTTLLKASNKWHYKLNNPNFRTHFNLLLYENFQTQSHHIININCNMFSLVAEMAGSLAQVRMVLPKSEKIRSSSACRSSKSSMRWGNTDIKRRNDRIWKKLPVVCLIIIFSLYKSFLKLCHSFNKVYKKFYNSSKHVILGTVLFMTEKYFALIYWRSMYKGREDSFKYALRFYLYNVITEKGIPILDYRMN